MTQKDLRRLDVKVARKVLGWGWKKINDAVGLLPQDLEVLEGSDVATTLQKGIRKDPYFFVRNYSSNLNDSWEIMEKLGMTIEPAGSRWKASLGSTVAIADSPAVAICRCALRAKGVAIAV